MSYDFSSQRTVVGRKEHVCEQCRKAIPMGERHSYFAGKFDGQFWTYREHADCRVAWLALITRRDDDFYDGVAFLCDDDIEPAEREWMRSEHPAVAERLGWTP